MVLQDVECIACGTVSEEMVDRGAPDVLTDCERCREPTLHRVLIRGGCKFRDPSTRRVWPDDPAYYEGQVKVGASFVNETDDDTSTEGKYWRPHDQEQYDDKVDRFRWRHRRDRVGRKILYFS